MNQQPRTKRGWLYAGLAVEPGVALTRRIDERAPRLIAPAPGRRIVLVGDTFARGVFPTLHKVLADHGTSLVLVPPSDTLARLNDIGPSASVIAGAAPRDELLAWTQASRQRGLPTLFALPPGQQPDVAMLTYARRAGARVVPTQSLPVPFGPDGKTATASGFAALAGAIWTWLR